MDYRIQHKEPSLLRTRLTIVGLFAVLAALAIWADSSRKLNDLEQTLSVQAVPSAMLDNGKLGKLLVSNGMVISIDNDFSRFGFRTDADTVADSLGEEDLVGPELNLFSRKRAIDDRLYLAASSSTPKAVVNSPDPQNYSHPGVPFVVLEIGEKLLMDPDYGILTNPTQRGRGWERPATLTVFRGGKEQMTGNAGLRLHGQWRGETLLAERHDYRLDFRNRYGLPGISSSLIFTGKDKGMSDTLVFENERILEKLIAMEFAASAGLDVPGFTPAVLSINGSHARGGILRSRVTTESWGSEVDAHVELVRSDDGPRGPNWELRREIEKWYVARSKYRTMKYVSQFFDLDNLTDSIIFNMYCGSNNWHDWAAYREKSEGARWRWITWNYDTCFTDRWQTADGPLAKQIWYQVAASRDSQGELTENYVDPRIFLFVQMMNLDPDYPRYFRNRMNRFLNEVATPARLLPILDQYAGIFENFPLDPDENSGITIREITDFVMSRPVYLKSQVGTLVP